MPRKRQPAAFTIKTYPGLSSGNLATQSIGPACSTCAILVLNSFGLEEWEDRHRKHLIRPGQSYSREAYVRRNDHALAGVAQVEKFLWRSCPCGSKHLMVERDGAIVLNVTLGGEA